MPTDQNPQHGRRPQFHRGRRGQDRRGNERRGTPQPLEQGAREGGRDHVDVEQIMREIRSRISHRHGIELTTLQIQELAARRLEAILDPRTVKPSLLEQIRRSAATPADTDPVETSAYTFEENTLYESPRGSLRFIRRLLNPLLKLFFNLTPLIHALVTQTRVNKAAVARESERDRRQAEWNALHYDILQRLVTEIARTSIDTQNLSMRVEALSAKVDFAERRTRTLEGSAYQARPAPRSVETASPVTPAAQPVRETQPLDVVAATPGQETSAESGRRRRRRRRGRRPQGFAPEGAGMSPAPGSSTPDLARDQATDSAEALDVDETDEDDMPDLPREEEGSFTPPATTAAEPAASRTEEAAAHAGNLPEPAPPATTAESLPSQAPTLQNDASPADDIDGTDPFGSSKG